MKKRRPMPLHPNPLARLLPLPESERTRIKLALLSSLDSIASGNHPGRSEWDAVTDVLNIMDTLESQRKIAVAPGLVQRAEDAMRNAAQRYKAGKGLRLDGPGMQDVREVIGVYLWLVDNWTEAKMRQATADTIDRLRAALAEGNCTVVDMTEAQ